MIIYKDIITNDELFTDCNKVTLVDDCLYEVTCHHISRKIGEVHIDGANPSAEGEDGEDGVDDGQNESGLDLVLNQGLCSTSFDKNSYKLYLKTYFKSLQEKWKADELTPEQIEEAKGALAKAAKILLGKLKDAEYYMGSSMNPDGMVAILEYRNNAEGVEEPIMLFFKHGLEAEKV